MNRDMEAHEYAMSGLETHHQQQAEAAAEVQEHDPALCETVNCELCAAFEAGYHRGKAKGFFDLEMWYGSHDPACGCEPCRIARGILASPLSFRLVWVDLAEATRDLPENHRGG